MALIGVILLVALMIPIIGILIDSPIGRALARRLEGPQPTVPPSVVELARKVDLLESEVDDLTRSGENLREENAFLQKLIEAAPTRSLPPASSP